MATSTRKPRILVAGLGNLILRDDGIGVHAVRALREGLPRGVVAADVGTAVLDALHLFEWADKVLAIDAMQAGGEPGTIYMFGPDDVEESGVKASLHELSLVAALRFLPDGKRPQVTILGVEPEVMDYGLDLSESVQNTVPQLVKAAREIVEEWRR
jgi:hydrogenase maturation protease